MEIKSINSDFSKAKNKKKRIDLNINDIYSNITIDDSNIAFGRLLLQQNNNSILSSMMAPSTLPIGDYKITITYNEKRPIFKDWPKKLKSVRLKQLL